MSLGDDKTTVTAVVTTELKERLKKIAKSRRWSLSQAVSALIDDCIDDWEKGIGVDTTPTKKPKKNSIS